MGATLGVLCARLAMMVQESTALKRLPTFVLLIVSHYDWGQASPVTARPIHFGVGAIQKIDFFTEHRISFKWGWTTISHLSGFCTIGVSKWCKGARVEVCLCMSVAG